MYVCLYLYVFRLRLKFKILTARCGRLGPVLRVPKSLIAIAMAFLDITDGQGTPGHLRLGFLA